MTEAITQLWLNIDKFNYMDRERLRISKYDVESLKVARKNLILKPGLCLIVTMIFSRYRTKLWSFTKNYFIGNRSNINKYKISDIKTTQSDLNSIKNSKTEEVIIQYRNPDMYSDIDESNKVAISNSRKVSSRRKKLNGENSKDDIVNIPREEPTYSQEYLSFLNKYGSNVRKFAIFKSYTNNITGKEKILESGETFLMKTKLIYIPFLILLIFALYDLGYTYVGIYFKYQPLIDEYYRFKSNKIK
jgi:hypothetical protein